MFIIYLNICFKEDNAHVYLLLAEQLKSHCSHLKGFSPVCVRMCLFMSDLILNLESQYRQENGVSPVCLRR